MRKTLLLSALICLTVRVLSQPEPPEKFLGYKVGSQFTPHWKLLSYFNHVALQSPRTVRVEQYGTTTEGRPLVLAFIASPENLSRLEEIRRNNLRLAHLASDGQPGNQNTPAIVWLSFNVHGNEASSSETAMLTLFSLADPSDTRSKSWLKNTVIIIDPCINPDGRDRYVNWYNSVKGKYPNPEPDAREHMEPWPGGRTNHYNFDLNRDWAWQSQTETQQRLKKYNAWLPQIHVDFHEQGYNDPYFFAPAAEPYHEVITPWQKDFQTQIGRNHAKYFDEHGWLYFTKGGGFDLFYPSYGDTYPTFNGAVGMTYEQGGGPRGGLGVVTDDGDTLTLEDRVTHHFTTALSTIEIASANASKLIREFHSFFNNALSQGVGEYKSYIVKRSGSRADPEALLEQYLGANGIIWGYASSGGRYKGFNYVAGKDEVVTVEKEDIIISAYQPKSALLQVLFEPRAKQAEVKSVPYDITAWSLPYALGLDAYAVKDRITPQARGLQPIPADTTTSQSISQAYAYLIPWKHLASARVLAGLLKKGVRVRYQEQPFSVNGKDFEAGTLLVTKAANTRFGEKLYDIIRQTAKEHQDFRMAIEPVRSGFVEKGVDLGSEEVKVIKTPKIALLTGPGTDPNAAGTIWHFFEQQLEYPVTLLNAAQMDVIDLRPYNVLIMPNAYEYRFLNDRTLNEQLKSWVRQGGKLIALEGAIGQLADADWGIRNKAEAEHTAKDTGENKDIYLPVKRYADRVKEELVSVNSGTIFRVELDNTHPLGYGYGKYYFTLKQDNAVYEFIKKDGWNVGVLKKNNYVSGFLGSRVQERLVDGLLFGVQDMGRGSVVYLADDVLFRSFWENGKLLFCNALFMVGQ